MHFSIYCKLQRSWYLVKTLIFCIWLSYDIFNAFLFLMHLFYSQPLSHGNIHFWWLLDIQQHQIPSNWSNSWTAKYASSTWLQAWHFNAELLLVGYTAVKWHSAAVSSSVIVSILWDPSLLNFCIKFSLNTLKSHLLSIN